MKGSEKSMINKNARYWNDEGIIQYKSGEIAKAKECWKNAALNGNKNAMFELGILELRKKIDIDTLINAREWFNCALEHGHKNAYRQIEKINAAINSGDFSIISIPNSFAERPDRINLHSKEIVSIGGIEWMILKKTSDMSLCLSVDIISVRRYHESKESVTWQQSSLRKWLNDEFLTTFNLFERASIVPVKIENCCNLEYGTSGGEETIDNVFLLSLDEVYEYFGVNVAANESDNDLLCRADASSELIAFLNVSDNELKRIFDMSGHDFTAINGSALGWWLRSPGIDDKHAVRVNCRGTLRLYGREVDRDLVGVRPAMWIKKLSIK